MSTNTVHTLSPELLASLKRAREARAAALVTSVSSLPPPMLAHQDADVVKDALAPQDEISHPVHEKVKVITYNEKQSLAIRLAGTEGRDTIIIGAAGTGKTTCQQAVVQAMIQSGRAGLMQSEGHKYLPNYATPGIVVISFTRRAVNNIRKVMSNDMKGNCITHHKLLEYEPVFYDVYDHTTGETRTTMQFQATRHKLRTLSEAIRTIIIEEGSMYSTEMYAELLAACPHKPQIIILGDIQQLPPVFGSAILGYKMLEVPCVELTEVYRQALDSPIIRLAHRVLSGVPIELNEFKDWEYPGQLKIHAWKKKLSEDGALRTLARFFAIAYDTKEYNPDEHMILVPFNKGCGTNELNCFIAQHIAKTHRRQVFEIVAGIRKVYFAIGDKVLYEKEDAKILKIEWNTTYAGTIPQPASEFLNYFGHLEQEDPNAVYDEDAAELILASAALDNDEDAVRKASHKITLWLEDSEREVTIDTAGSIASMSLGYAITVHKAQGSEAKKVFLCLHWSHASQLQRELLYTAITRAKEYLYVICEPESFVKGIVRQRIKGNTLAEKAEFFKGKAAAGHYTLNASNLPVQDAEEITE